MRRDKKEPETTPQTDAPQEDTALATLPEAPEMKQEMPPQVIITSPAPPREEPRPPAPPQTSNAKNLWRALVFLFKLGLFLVFLAALAAVLYFGLPIVYTQYILPVQENTVQLSVLETQQQASQDQLYALQTQIPPLLSAQDQLYALQTQIPALLSAQDQQALTLTAILPNMEAIATTVGSHTLSQATLIAGQTSLQTNIQSQQTGLELQAGLLKSMELLSRARLFLYQSNFGLAKQDIQSARDLLANLLNSPGAASIAQAGNINLAELVQRLDLALARLPEFPVAASDDLDIAWQLLLGAPQPDQMPTLTPSPLPFPIIEATPTLVLPLPSETPAPFPSPTTTAIP